ncbi:Cytoplasmic alpha-amylase [Clostridiaceae bacterium JG1575]|nr:Cytoplasmic alpha-amylase [Clostridiaceae bacterium JG1575]
MRKNGTLFQYFEWYMDLQNDLWRRLKDDAQHLKQLGITGVWIPPACKATSPGDTGYGVYDLYDLGEFDQKGSIKTKYGSREELIECIAHLKETGIDVYADAVLNHKAAGDEKEPFWVVAVDPTDRNRVISEPFEMEGWTRFTFPGRGAKYSDFQWNHTHFTGTDFNAATGERGIFRIEGEGKGWAMGVDADQGNFDYLMFNDLDVRHPEVVRDLYQWAHWFVETTGVSGMRFDAVKHINDQFIRDLAKDLKEHFGDDFYTFGEYWTADASVLEHYLTQVDYTLDLFDVALHFHFYEASRAKEQYDLRTIFDGTLVQSHPELAVTFVDNHDSQPGQSLESFVAPWFKPLAYALILLRADGYPTIFYGDYYGISSEEPIEGHAEVIDRLLHARSQRAYGEQVEYPMDATRIGFARLGDAEHPDGLAVVMSSGEGGSIEMAMGELHAHERFVDWMGHWDEPVVLDERGVGCFPCPKESLCVWSKEYQEVEA